jgi:16S rRNA (guanine966-N2)-methyltransferase
MLRVVAGTAGGLRLHLPKGASIRPTQDRIKQVIFSSLADRVVGATVLDLYSGTGALGIEALSRGATRSTFVDADPRCIACIQRNLTHCKFIGQPVVLSDAGKFLQGVKNETYHVIFADPPYQKSGGSLDNLDLLIQLSHCLNEGGWLIYEHASRQAFCNPPSWEIVRHRLYGETALTFLRKIP